MGAKTRRAQQQLAELAALAVAALSELLLLPLGFDGALRRRWQESASQCWCWWRRSRRLEEIRWASSQHLDLNAGIVFADVTENSPSK